MRKLIRRKKAQVLVVAVTAMFVLFIIGIAIIEIGNLTYEKVHMQNIADSGAMEAGTWYARSLNMISLSNKMLVVTTGIALAATTISGGTTWLFWKDLLKGIETTQDFFAGTGEAGKAQVVPWLCWGSVILNGKRNDALSLAVFNVETFDKNKLPSFNLKRRTLSDVIDKEQLLTKYYYVEEATGRKVNVPKNEVKKNRAGRIYQDGTGKFVIKEQGLGDDTMPEDISKMLEGISKAIEAVPLLEDAFKALPFDIVETGPHTVLVGSFKDKIPQKTGTRFFLGDNKKPIEPFLMSCALVRMDGGSMYFWEMDGASYSPHLDKVQLPNLTSLGSAESREILGQAGKYVKENNSAGFSEMFGYLDKAGKLLTDGVLLH